MCNLLIHIDISTQRKGQVSHLLSRNTWINYHTFDEERLGRLQLVVRLPTIIARKMAQPFGILRLNFKVGFIAYWNMGGLYCCSIRYAWTISTAFLTAELNFSELKLVPISSRTRKHFSRMRTARLPTVSNCIPGPMSGGGGENIAEWTWYHRYPPLECTLDQIYPHLGQNDWQTPVKTLPSSNFIGGR